ncbi:hypothetical protein NKH33_31565 [Mesorhizobium sp. M1182]|uniref:hypothetical protein n=1 Tax=Mesorhizobium sp. M1182 TaxID=2957067 RepID=UPI00333BC963
MFDAGYCAGMTLGRPEIGIEGLNELTIVLTALGANRKQGAQSRPSRKKERDGAKKPISQSRADPPVGKNTKGLVETLADLLLEALAAEADQGGGDEPEDHA